MLLIILHFRLVEDMHSPGCGLVQDRIYFDDKVVIGCGSSATTQIWNLDTDEIYMTDFTCPTNSPAKFKKLDDQTLILTNTFDGQGHIFTAEYGFESAFQGISYQSGDSFVAPSGYVKCKYDN